MNLPLSPRRVDTLLSLIVISWGFWLLAWRLSPDPLWFFSPSAYGFHGWSRPFCGLLLLVFFPFVVDQIGYWSTGQRNRGKRIWSFPNLAAIPFVLYAMYWLLRLVGDCFFVFSLWVAPRYSFDLVEVLSYLLFEAVISVSLLFLARPMAAWMVRRVEKAFPELADPIR